MNDLQRFKDTYITECYELLEDMEARLLGMDGETTNLEELNAIFRCAHSIKGGSGAFGFSHITRFTHILEALLDAMREGKVPVSRDAVDALLRSVDVVTQLVQAAKEDREMDEHFGDDVAADLQAVASESGVKTAVAKQAAVKEQLNDGETVIYQISFKPYPDIFVSGNEPLLIIRELKQLGKLEVVIDTVKLPDFDHIDAEKSYFSWEFSLETQQSEERIHEVFEFVEDECELVIKPAAGYKPQEKKPATATATEEAKPAASGNVTSIRVDVDKVDKLVNMVGELVITQAMLVAQTKDLPVDTYQKLIDGVIELSQHTRELQEAVMSVRMQSVKSVFSRMPRIVRDLSKQLGKDIRIEMSGENTEVDKTVIEQLSDPLTHMIRNSMDHGIETPEDRIQKGKPAQGVIRLSADHRGGRIVIEVEDDGAGINREKVLKSAREKGLVAPDATLSNEEIDALIFMPGFSTAAEVTAISGRGVGMDVVKRNITAMGGVIETDNRPGQGSCFTISLPLTLAILDGMIVRVGTEHYIIPIGNIIETMRPKADEVRKIADGSEVINVRGEFIVVLYLHQTFGISNAVTDPANALVVLVESGRHKFGLVVDELVGQQQVVIKSLTENSDPVDGISGATILGDGKVSLILDIAGLQQIVSQVQMDENGADQLCA